MCKPCSTKSLQAEPQRDPEVLEPLSLKRGAGTTWDSMVESQHGKELPPGHTKQTTLEAFVCHCCKSWCDQDSGGSLTQGASSPPPAASAAGTPICSFNTFSGGSRDTEVQYSFSAVYIHTGAFMYRITEYSELEWTHKDHQSPTSSTAPSPKVIPCAQGHCPKA